MSSATQLELTVAEGLLTALDTDRGLETARRLLGDEHLEADTARPLLEAMIEEAAHACPVCGAGGFDGSCVSCALAEADTKADYPATNIGQDGNLPEKDLAKARHRSKKRKKKDHKVHEATYIGNTTAGGTVGGTRTAWGGTPFVTGDDDSVLVGARGGDRDFQPRVSTGWVDAVLARGDVVTSPPNLREGEGWQSCASCVFFHKGCNLYGWDRDGTPGRADVVHRGQFPVDPDDLCDAWTTLLPNQARLVESLDREDARLAEAALAENGEMIVRARARVGRASERLAEELGTELPRQHGESADAYTRRALVEMWSPAARAASALTRREHGGGGGFSPDPTKVRALKLGQRADLGGGYQVHHAPDVSAQGHSYYVSHNGSHIARTHAPEAAVQAIHDHANPPKKMGSRERVAGARELYGPRAALQHAALEEMWSPAARAAALLSRHSGSSSPLHDALGSHIPHEAKLGANHYETPHDAPGAARIERSSLFKRESERQASRLNHPTSYKGAEKRAYGEMIAHQRGLHAALVESWFEFLEEVKSDAYPGLDRSPKKNWVDKAGGLPRYIERIAKHLHYEKGKDIGHAIAIAVNAVKKMCAAGDTNFPGKQNVNAKSRSEACAAVAQWEAKKGKAKAKTVAESSFQWDDFDAALGLWEAAHRPIPPSDRFIENLNRELALAEGRADWMLGLAAIDEAEALFDRYADQIEEGVVGVGLDEGIVQLFHRNAAGWSGHWDPIRHPRAPKGRRGGGEFARSGNVLAKIEAKARGGVGGRDRQRGYRHPEDAPAHERMVAEMFDMTGGRAGGGRLAGNMGDRSIMPAERKALGSYLRRKGAADVAKQVEDGRSRMLTDAEARAIATAVRGDGKGIGPIGRQNRKPTMPELGGRKITVQKLPGRTPGHFVPFSSGFGGTFAPDATSVEDAFKDHNAAHGRRNEGASSIDQAISNTLKSFPGLEDWDVKKEGPDYHLSVKVKGDTHVISVNEKGETTYLSGPQAKELGKAAKTVTSKAAVKAAVSKAMASGAQPIYEKPAPHVVTDMLANLEPTGEKEKPYHMQDGDFFKGTDGVMYQKLESGPHLMMSKKGQPLAAVLIHNHKTGTQKVAPAFALSTYYDVYRPKGHGGGGSSVVAKPAPSHDDIEAQLAASIAGQKGISKSADMPHAGTAPHGEKLDVKGKNVVITGTIPGMARDTAMAKLKAHGAYPQSSVTNQTHYLIVGENAGKAKPAAAAKKGAKVVPVSQIMHLLESTDLDAAAAAELAPLVECLEALAEDVTPSERVRLRARRDVLLDRLGLELHEAPLTAAKREKLPKKSFAIPESESYPIHDENHARNALSRVAQHGSPSEKARVKAAVKRRYPHIGS